MSRKKEKSVGHVEMDGKHGVEHLVNDENSTWRARSAANNGTLRVRRGESLPLMPGTIANFGDDRRLFLVRE